MARHTWSKTVSLPSDHLHQALLRNRQYRTWHRSPAAQVVHWAILISLVLGGVLGFALSQALRPGIGLAAGMEPTGVVVREIVEKIVLDRGAAHKLTQAEFYEMVRALVGEHAAAPRQPQASVRRVEAVQVIVDLAGISLPARETAMAGVVATVPDLDEGGWYGPYLEFAITSGLLHERADGRLAPYEYLTPSEAVVLFAAAAPLLGLNW